MVDNLNSMDNSQCKKSFGTESGCVKYICECHTINHTYFCGKKGFNFPLSLYLFQQSYCSLKLNIFGQESSQTVTTQLQLSFVELHVERTSFKKAFP